jgi:hypothetical protein
MGYRLPPWHIGWRRRCTREKEKMTMDREILIEALEIAKNSFDYDAEYHKAKAVQEYIKQLEGGDDE